MTAALGRRFGPVRDDGSFQDSPIRSRLTQDSLAQGRLAQTSLVQGGLVQAVAAYVVPSIIVALITLSWFQPGAQIGNGDVSPLIRRSINTEIGSLWNHQVTGAGGTSLAAASSIDAGFVRLFGSPEAGQRGLFVAALVLTVLGVVHAVRRVVHSPLVAGITGLLAVFNPFLLLYLPNLIFPLAIGALGLLVGEIGRHAKDGTSSPIKLALLTLPVAYLSTNPPLLVMIMGSVVVALGSLTVVYGSNAGRASLRLLSGAAPLAVLIHLWWIVPFLQVYVGGAVGTEFAAVTNTENWSWVFANNSLDRVVTLTAHWGWDERSFFPWVPSVETGPWLILRWSLPAGALAGLVVALRTSWHHHRGARVLGVVGFTLVVISQGVHAPFAPINQFLFDSVPGWWLFREPVNKFGPALILVYLLAFSLFLEAALHALWRMQPIAKVGGVSTALGVAGTALLFPLPLLNGEVIPDDRPGLPSAHVSVPGEWQEIGDLVSGSATDGKVLVLPVNQYYQVTTSWGYHGVDLAPQFFDRPVIQILPGGYFGELDGYESLVRTVENSLLDGDLVGASAAAQSLGVSHIVVRRDVESGPLGLRYGDSPTMAGHASELAGAAVIHDGPIALVVELVDSPGLFRLTSDVLVSDGPLSSVVADTGRPAIPRSADRPSLLVPAAGLTWAASNDRDQVTASSEEAGSYRVAVTSRSEFFVDMVRDSDEAGTVLSFKPTLGVSADESQVEFLPAATLSIGSGGYDQILVDGRVVSTSAPFPVSTGATIASRRMVSLGELGDPKPAGDCNKIDERGLDELGIASRFEDPNLIVTANEHTGCVVIDVPALDRPGELHVPFEVREGEAASACLWQPAQQACIDFDRITSTTGELVVQQPVDVMGLELFLYADASQGRSEVAYGRVDQQMFVTLAATQVGALSEAVVELGAGDHLFSSNRLVSRSVLGSFGELGDCNNTDERSPQEAGLVATRVGELIRLEASAHTACLTANVAGDEGDSLTVSFEHRTLSGRPARYCLWVEGPGICAQSGALVSSSAWEVETVAVTVPAGARSIDLYLYADGPDDGATNTVVEFRSVEVARANPERIVVRKVAEESETPTAARVEASHVGPGRWDVSVSGLDRSTLLVAAESYSQGWELNGLPQGWSAEPVMVDGWSQGWWLNGSGDADLQMIYGPGRLTAAANMSSGFGLLGLAVVGLLRRKRL